MTVSHETLSLPANIIAQIQQRQEGSRKVVHHHGLVCSKCLASPPASARDRYCRECRATYNRIRRKAERAELKRLRALVQERENHAG